MATVTQLRTDESLSSFRNPPTNCPDWIFASGSTVSIAKNRSSFISYNAFSTYVTPTMGDSKISVAGIGTVAIRILNGSANRRGQEDETVITVERVLHAPNALCNILGLDFAQEHNPSINYRQRSGTLRDGEGHAYGLLEQHPNCTLMRLKLAGPSHMATALSPGVLHSVSVYWPKEEYNRWNDHISGESPLTHDEKQWLNQHWGGEFRFLRAYRLNIHKEDDRVEGRAILRAFMSQDE